MDRLAQTEGAPAPARVLFVTSNGTGLGHLTRSMAIAKRLGAPEPLFITFSAAAPVVHELGFPVEYVASYDRPGAGNDLTWTRRARARLEQAVAEIDPAVVVFDGTHPYERLLPALRSTGAPLVWCRRAMWRSGSDTAPLWRSHLFDAVLEPGEWAAEADAGPTVPRRSEAEVVDPIVLLDREELLGRADAERELGLEPGRQNALVQLGQGEGVREASRRCLRHLADREGVQVVALASTLAGFDEPPEGIVPLRATYPISRFFAAFDLVVAASGYNAFHELIQLGPPALFVPMPRQTDDQAARARHAEQRGVAVASLGPGDPSLETKLDVLLDPAQRAEMGERLAQCRGANGATDAARWVEGFGPGFSPVSPGSRDARPAASSTTRRAWIFASSVPRTALRIGRQMLTRPRPRTLVIALGLAGDALSGELRKALDETGERPERMLVVTDALDFAPLLATGVGFEHLPAQDSREAQLAGVPYPRFRLERLRSILARRPRPRRILALGDVPSELEEAARRR